MKTKLFLSVLLGFCILLLLVPVSSGDAQTSEWTPAWVDFSDSGNIHIVGLDDANPKPLPSDSNIPPDEHGNPISSGVSSTLRRFFASLGHSLDAPSGATAGWETIFSDDLEGAFPGAWDVFDNDDATNGEYFWAKRDCNPYAGSNSAWVVGGGADGSGLTCGSDYPDYADSWMIYGPFSLEDATEAEFRLMFWLNSEPTFDPLFVGASTNGTNFFGESTSGDYDWTQHIFDLSNVFTLGDLTGEPQVWVVIAYQSDSTIHYSEGAYVDDIEILQYVGDSPTPTPTSTLTPTYTLTPTGTPSATPTVTQTPIPDESGVYLPMVIRNFPFTPDPPVLNAIDNGDGDGNYTVSWSSSAGASTYTLQEDSAQDFSNPTTVYTGSGTSKTISGRDVGKYYYRVRAFNIGATSGWSNVESVDVTVPPPACPQAGAWSGTNDQGRNISFVVENSPQCQIAAGSLKITIRDSCYITGTTTFFSSIPITNNHFSVGSSSYGVQVTGDFTSATTSSGTYNLVMANPFPPPPVNCTASGTWTATP